MVSTGPSLEEECEKGASPKSRTARGLGGRLALGWRPRFEEHPFSPVRGFPAPLGVV